MTNDVSYKSFVVAGGQANRREENACTLLDAPVTLIPRFVDDTLQHTPSVLRAMVSETMLLWSSVLFKFPHGSSLSGCCQCSVYVYPYINILSQDDNVR